MHHHYGDILERIAEPPSWWDENGTPRYGEFSPCSSPNIYADQVVLLQIRCQECGDQFRVEMNCGAMDRAYKRPTLEERVRDGSIHYGDPPAHGCIGDTMNSIPERVLEFWSQPDPLKDWTRAANLEVDIACKWAT